MEILTWNHGFDNHSGALPANQYETKTIPIVDQVDNLNLGPLGA